MKTVKLNIAFNQHKAGEVMQLDDRIAKHFIAKGWADEVTEEKVEKVKKVKK